MKNIFYLFLLMATICFSQDQINIGDIINKPYKFEFPVQQCSCNTTILPQTPIYRRSTNIVRESDILDVIILRNALKPIKYKQKSSLDLTPVEIIDNN